MNREDADARAVGFRSHDEVLEFQQKGLRVNHIDRMLEERSETVIRVHRLQAFIASETYKELDTLDQELMVTQRYVMHLYIGILTQRLERATRDAASKLS